MDPILRRSLALAALVLLSVEIVRRLAFTAVCYVELRYNPYTYRRPHAELWAECRERHLYFPLYLFQLPHPMNPGQRFRVIKSLSPSVGGWHFEAGEEFEYLGSRSNETAYYRVLKSINRQDNGKIINTPRDFFESQDQGYITLISPSTPSTMTSVIQALRNTFLPKNEQLFRKSGLKDSCGNWTDDAKAYYLESKMNGEADAVLLPAAQQIIDEQAKDSAKK